MNEKAFPRQARPLPTKEQLDNARSREKLGLKNGKRPQHPRIPKWSHQDELAHGVGKKIEITYRGDEAQLTGTLMAADQFALKVLVDHGGFELVIFKHDIGAFRVL